MNYKPLISYVAIIAMYFVGINVKAQTSTLDTIKINIGGEFISVPMPKMGNKITLNLEDSNSIIQISIGKTSKFNTIAAPNTNRNELSKNRISWFNEINFGLATLVGLSKNTTTDTSYGYVYAIGSSISSNPANFIKITPKRVNAGFSFGFTIKEKSRPIGTTPYRLVTGSRFRFSKYRSNGDFHSTDVKYAIVNNAIKIYPDSVLSESSGNYKAVTNAYQLLLPLLVERNIIKDKYQLAFGLNIGIGFNSTRINYNYGGNLKNNKGFSSSTNAQLLFQPAFRLTNKRYSLQVSYSPGFTRINYNTSENVSGHMLYISFGYKLY